MRGGLAQKVDWSQRWAQWKYIFTGSLAQSWCPGRCPHNDSLLALSRPIGVLWKGPVAKLLAGSSQALSPPFLPRLLLVS